MVALGNLALFLGFSVTPTLLKWGFAVGERYWPQLQKQLGKMGIYSQGAGRVRGWKTAKRKHQR